MGRKITVPPQRSFEVCFDYSKKLYDIFSHKSFSKPEIASVLNFSSNSGGFGIVFTSMRAFGFIIQDVSNFTLSEDFKKLKNSSSGSAQFHEVSLKMIKNVDLYNELLKDFRNSLPSQDNIIQRLEISFKFSPINAKKICKTFVDSLRFAKLLDPKNNIIMPKVDNSIGEQNEEEIIGESSQQMIEETEKDRQKTVDIKKDYGFKTLGMEIPLTNERFVKIIYPIDIKKEEVEKISSIIKLVHN